LTFASPVVKSHYLTNIRRFPEWTAAEETRRQTYGDPAHVEGSILSFVPKNDKISRAICTEPVLGMFYQLGLGAEITGRLKSYFAIDLNNQPDRNRELACQGSVTGLWSTIDLESASDTISVNMLKAALPQHVFNMLMVLRSPVTVHRGKAIALDMISSMGNGFTFPLETVVFSAAVKSAYMSLGLKRTEIAVFGDDIVCVSQSYNRLTRLLSLLGFRVNAEKSFNEGPFRESCGKDYYKGENIRGVYLKRLDSVQDSYALINALNDFSSRTGVVLARTVKFLLRRLGPKLFEVPAWEDPSCGLRLPRSLVKRKHLCRNTQAALYTKYVFRARRIRIGDGFIRTPFGVKRIMYNPSGLLLAFVSGMALSSGLPMRRMGNWKTERRVSSSWNSLESNLRKEVGWQRWETAVELNLIS
jgi:hypothetical protein